MMDKTQTDKDKRFADMYRKCLGVATSDCIAGECVTLSTQWHKEDALIGSKTMRSVIMDDLNEPAKPTRFWECEYCGTVNPIDTLDCRAKACGHSVTRKAMEEAWEGPKAPQDKIDEAKAHTPKMQVYGPGAEDVVIDHSEPIGKYTTPEGAFVSLCNWRIGL
jgi:hypothetical protein